MTVSTKWTDRLVMTFSLIVITLSAWWMIRSGVFNFTLLEDQKLAWHLTRSAGIVSYVLLLASTVWGLFVSNQLLRDWSPGPVSMTLHSTISWLAILLGLTHGLLLMFDDYFTYTLSNILVPFTGPYRPEVVGLGTLAFWMLVVIALSFPFKKVIGHRVWQRLHYVSYAAFGLVTAHGLLAGTDGEHLGFRLLVGIGMVVVIVLLGVRLRKDQTRLPASVKKTSSTAVRRSAAVEKRSSKA
jgi:predicted ferric reductase